MDILKDPKFATVTAHYERACKASRLHKAESARALANYGDHGPQISGCVRDHFPSAVKERLRNLAQIVGREMDAAKAARPKYVRMATIIDIGRSVATRDGVGFYGPSPWINVKL